MGSVVTTFKVMPESAEVDMDKLESRIKEKVNPARIERVPIAFGLNAIQLVISIPEKDGELEKVTKEIKKIEGVAEAEIVNATRSM